MISTLLNKARAPVARARRLFGRHERVPAAAAGPRVDFDPRLLPALACPETHATLRYVAADDSLVSEPAGRIYPIVDGIPVLLVDAEAPAPDRAVSAFVERYDEMVDSAPMRALYADSGYFNVGYWDDGAADLVAACDRLTDRMAGFAPADPELIVDVGCGVGAGSARIARRFPDATVLAVNLSHGQLLRARRRGVVAPAVMDAARLGVASGAADAVFAIESAQHFDTRAAFIAEAHRVLRPGGVIALADMLFADRELAGTWMLPPGNWVDSIAEYEQTLAQAGFTDIEVRDVTGVTWAPFCDQLRSVYPGRESKVDALEASLDHYVIATARKA